MITQNYRPAQNLGPVSIVSNYKVSQVGNREGRSQVNISTQIDSDTTPHLHLPHP
ncbi:MAG: hypothetical protein IGR76_11000 [Synechococcales cyanobacterium T60_A2020_003]|nr:hypothetical protein [Synechococcales cyanobacterium T60_A2020_003]